VTSPLRIGIAGLGTVGAETARLLLTRTAELSLRAGRTLSLVAVNARDKAKDRGLSLEGVKWIDDPVAMARDPNIDVFVELIGGEGDPARTAVAAALSAGKRVVTANKALIAGHGVALAKMAEEHGGAIHFEASAAGGIPIIKALREGLAANRISSVFGILNGTCNYILTTMEKSGRTFDDVLAEAQAKGYAEADPTFDIDGMDTAHKLCILNALAFGMAPSLEGMYVEGIRRVSTLDIAFAAEFKYRIKLLGIGDRTANGVSQRVHPAMVRHDTPLADVDGAFNAVVAVGDLVGTSVYEGRGAGGPPTASAVIADICDAARTLPLPMFGRPVKSLERPSVLPVEEVVGAFYLRFRVLDRPGVLAGIARTLADHGISIESMIQRGRSPGEPVHIVMITHEASEGAMAKALSAVARGDLVVEEPARIRIMDAG
jgi:homoserine dehydrogenase